ncbi:MAG: four helix bundle protein [Bacteroidales bacterium]|nr:four helix bundle protein [Bacteroidales bacterium]
MKTSKNTEIYRMAFELAVRVYRLNMSLPANRLVVEGHRLRRSSVRVKDALSEAFAMMAPGNSDAGENYLHLMILAQTSCNETISQLRQILGISYLNKNISELINSYRNLRRKINKHIQDNGPGGSVLTLPFPSVKNTGFLTLK